MRLTQPAVSIHCIEICSIDNYMVGVHENMT